MPLLTESYWPADSSEPLWETTVGGALRQVAGEIPDQVALVSGMANPADRRRWTYRRLLTEAEAVARALLARFEPGERVAVWAPNIPEWVLLQYGAALAGLVLVTVNPAYRKDELAYVLRQSGSVGIFLLPDYRGNPMAASLDEVRGELPDLRDVVLFTEWEDFVAGGRASAAVAALPDVKPDDAAMILYTSGTTGFPKGAVLHHRGIVNDARAASRNYGLGPGETFLTPMPFFHAGGCVLGVIGSMATRGVLVAPMAFEPGLMLELIETERAVGTGGVPTMLIACMEHPDFATRDVSSLRVVVSGGAPVPADLVRRIEAALGARFSIVFGQTECSAVATQTRLDDTPEDKAQTVGQPLPHVEVKITDEFGATVAPGTLGELCIRGYLVMHGYHDKPEATAEAIDADSWLHTGDLATMDARGYCRIEGRLKDMIIRGGENIYPREIEAVLFGHPSVADVAVVGVPDERWGEQVAAFVRPADPAARPSTSQLHAHVRDQMAHYKVPKYWLFVEEFPLTGSGKVQKFVLRERFLKGELVPADE